MIVDRIYKVPKYNDRLYSDLLLELCKEHSVNFIIPLYEPELIQLAERKHDFLELGIKVIVSNTNSLEMCLDKFQLYGCLIRNGFSTPETYSEMTSFDLEHKWVVKPRLGMGSQGVYILESNEIAHYFSKKPNQIIQRFIEGQEYSIDAYVAEDGQILSVVPRLRLEVRSGEVSKSITVEDESLTLQSVELLKHLNLIGPVTIQGIKEKSTGKFYFIEVNPRFGGGVPLTIQSGIPYADFIAGKHNLQPGQLHPYQAGLKMLRYDEAVYVSE